MTWVVESIPKEACQKCEQKDVRDSDDLNPLKRI